MKKIILSAAGLLLILCNTQRAKAQVNFIRMGMNAATLAKRANKNGAAKADVTTATYQGKSFPMQRTPADKMPKKGAEQITALETQLDRCHAALLADANGALFTPEQRATLQTAIAEVGKAQPKSNLSAYQEEAAFYLAEDAHRQQAAPATPTN